MHSVSAGSWKKDGLNLEPAGQVIIHDLVMEENRIRPLAGAVFSVHMLLYSGVGHCHTFDEIGGWLTEAGFGGVEHIADYDDDHSLVTATR